MKFRTCEIKLAGVRPCRLLAIVRITTICVHEHIEIADACRGCMTDARKGILFCIPCAEAGYLCQSHLVNETLTVVAS